MIGMKQIEKLDKNKIGYISIENYSTPKPKVCEAPRHENQMLPAYAVIAIIAPEMYSEPVVQMICFECWKHLDDDMGHPNWNMMEWK
jgi:hypothetical protein